MMSEISTTRYQLIIPQHCRSNFGRQAFSVVGPNLHYPTLSDKFKVALKTHLYSEYQNRGVLRNRALNALRLTYLLVLRCVTHGIISVWRVVDTEYSLSSTAVVYHKITEYLSYGSFSSQRRSSII